MKFITSIIFTLGLLSHFTSCKEINSDNIKVSNIDQFNQAASNIKPGDKIVLANGIWKDAELILSGNGTADKKIILTVEEKGKVFLEGASYLRIDGEYIHVEGLVFRNGYTPVGEVISFRTSKDNLCNNCRVTECVIDDYNPKERFESDYWVGMYGRNGRFDHNYLVGKRNLGVTMAVRLDTENSRENNHRIDHNHFGFHPILGSNGGETLRIGTSHYSLTNSKTLVEDNYFEMCSGEHEIISNKSCQNTFRNNTFYECQGTLTMRHGNETLVENNYFFGNGKPNVGGIRIINETQTVKNNYCEGLTGYRFRGALVIMNGVPNSPINRYFQVKDSEASGNIFIDCDYIQLCAGSDQERSAVPVNTKMTNNIIYNTNKDDIFTVYDDISGITFVDNTLSPNVIFPSNKGKALTSGFAHQTLEFEEKNGLKLPKGINNIGPDVTVERPSSQNTGVSWYEKKDYIIRFNTGKKVTVDEGENTLFDAVKKSHYGDILVLKKNGKYHQSKSIDIHHPITITSESEAQKPILTFGRASLFNIENGGALSLKGLHISGKECDDYAGNNVIRTSKYSMTNNYKLIMKDCDFTDLDVNHSFNVLRVYKNTFADSIVAENCTFDNISGHVFELNKEIDDIGIYNVENVVINNCKFNKIGGTALDLHRGGGDESTFGPILQFTNSTLDNVGHDKRNKGNNAIHLHGTQFADFSNLEIKNSKKINLFLTVGDPVISLDDITIEKGEEIKSNDENYIRKNIVIKK